MNPYEIIVVGGGHAGIEAALAAARLNTATALLTLTKKSVGRMSCNPSVGGLAKSHIVCELDALGGEIGRNADYTGIHHRTLNTRKGTAVQATRIQCDKNRYPDRIQQVINSTPSLSVIEGLVSGLLVKRGVIAGVRMDDGSEIHAQAVILAPGTFLSGRIFIGDWYQDAGRIEDKSSIELSDNLKKHSFNIKRLKTGTPPRIHKDSLDYNMMECQPGDTPPPFFSRKAKREWAMFHVEQSGIPQSENGGMLHVEHTANRGDLGLNQLDCYLTHTTEETHAIIRDNLTKSSLYGGMIGGTGVRYCPSIEDKIVKFPDRTSHHVFIEPEGRDNVRIYPNGTSNSLPEDVQKKMIWSIPGMAHAEFIRPGYAIEYDFCDPLDLNHTLETKKIENLYMAGQINGTTGYEEAAGQGFVAGVNAVFKLRGLAPFVLSRSEAYIGVLIDDLVTKGTDEPYRMFTSRAEFRLTLRQGNAPLRLRKQSEQIGIVSKDVNVEIAKLQSVVNAEISRLEDVYHDGASLSQILRRPEISYNNLPQKNIKLSEDAVRLVETTVKYAGYIKRENARIEQLLSMDSRKIPPTLNYDNVPSLRLESREKLKRVMPKNLGQAARISGVNPSDIAILEVFMKREKY